MIYDLIIIGAGPAGLTASIYASRYGLKHLLIGALSGGLASTAYSIENYPGYKKISGGELMKQFTEQAKTYGIEILPEEIANIKKKKEIFEIKTNSDKKFQTKTIILALGTQHRKLGIPGEKKFLGRGISYCTTCDGPLYKDKVVAVVGGGDSALTSAIFLIKLAKKVYLIHRRKEFRAKIIWRDKINQSKKIVKVLARQIKEIKGNRVIQEIILDAPFQGKKNLKIDGLFVEIGLGPGGGGLYLDPAIQPQQNKAGYIETDYLMRTNIFGLLAAGDITGPTDKLRQIVTAAAEGAIAATSAARFCQK